MLERGVSDNSRFWNSTTGSFEVPLIGKERIVEEASGGGEK